MPVVYAAVARGAALLAEYARVGGNFSSVAADQLAHGGGGGGDSSAAPAAVADGFVYVVLPDPASGYTFLAVADEASGCAAADAFLPQLRGDFLARREGGSGGGGEIEAADSSVGDEGDYSVHIGELLAAAAAPRAPPSPTSLQRRVDAVKAAAGSNLELVALAGAADGAAGVDERAAEEARRRLEEEAGRFSGTARRLRERLRRSSCSVRASLALMVCAIVFLAVMLTCFGLNASYCSTSKGRANAPAPTPAPPPAPAPEPAAAAGAGVAPAAAPEAAADAEAARGGAGQAPPQQAGRRLRRLQGRGPAALGS
ncbi:hypothetical protein Rsub_00381 [Raphidocelis subcapitata]|uniref:Longin domain-containing protein n=1 Tax=Raphidocelis subcapitata TaxID=307507 RepID=A0A2V0NQ70_9CHLO|nr:hypothetical protein Rsub_00381 [Raphidocelis subcapitata]|eukprot:GBF87670.1 hypothetical protein Rsub_00381 [Raphidocelis subcapitata]